MSTRFVDGAPLVFRIYIAVMSAFYSPAVRKFVAEQVNLCAGANAKAGAPGGAMATVDACLSLINSKVTEQRARGVALLERGEFQTPDSVKHIDALLAALNHPLTESNIAIRQNVLRVLPALLQRCGGSLRSSLDRVLPHLAERLVDNDPQSRAFAARALHELFANTRAPAAIGALLAPTVLTRGVRVREMVFIFLCDVLHLTRGSVHADDLTLTLTLTLTKPEP